jgi:hypothetical protein
LRKKALFTRALAATLGALALWAVPAGADVYQGQGVPANIPDSGVADYPAWETLDVTFNVDLEEEIEDVRVQLAFSALATAEQLQASLIAPDGTRFDLFSRTTRSQGRTYTGLVGPYLFTDEAETTFWQVVNSRNALPGAYRTVPGERHDQGSPTIDPAPTSINDAFKDVNPKGTWILRMTDWAAGDQGRLEDARLAINEGDSEDQPEARILSLDGPSGLTNDRKPVFTWAAEHADRFVCSIDQGEPNWRACESATSHSTGWNELADGQYTFRVYAQQTWGVGQTEVLTREFQVDATPPTIAIKGIKATKAKQARKARKGKKRKRGAKRKLKGSARVRFSAQDAVTPAERLAVRCRVDAKPWRACASPLVLKGLSPGRHTIAIEATDEAGNVAQAEQRFRVAKAKKPRKAKKRGGKRR